jgi:DNA (cytosine-5)-methyltransferase 1
MKYGSVCSGIEAATHAWHPLGWEASFFSEIEDFPRKVLAHHYPNTPLHGDFTTIKENDYEPINLLVGGTPCQSFSVAGLRAGLDDPRGNLMLEFGALAKRLHPKWLVWENVPGVLSSNGGKDFATYLGMLAELGYGFAYRVLDAQHFGVPQRRRRLFVIGCLGDHRSAAAVLFEQYSLQRHTPQGKGTGQEVTDATRTISESSSTVTTNRMVAFGEYVDDDKASAIKQRDYKDATDLIAYNITFCDANGTRKDRVNGGLYVNETTISNTLTKAGIGTNVAHAFKVRGGCEGGGKGYLGSDNTAFTLSTVQDQQIAVAFSENQQGVVWEHDTFQSLNRGGGKPGQSYPAIREDMQVRRLMPIECERLQGFRDDFTNIPGASDSNRYKALGNSMAVPVMKWIGERIDMVEQMQKELR